MPRIDVVYYKEDCGLVPVLEWIDSLPRLAQNKCLERIERLECFGHELRRPLAENLGDGIWELRIKCRGDNYRILYFFHGRTAAVLAAGLLKNRSDVPQADIDRALDRKRRFEANPKRHTFQEEES